MRLSILIPTYRRPRNVEQTIVSIQTMFKDAPFQWEIVISNNIIPNSDLPVKLNFNVDASIKVVSPKIHLPTAEENFKFGLGFCSGELVWLLGDDDVLIPNGISLLIEELNKNNFDLLIAGSKMISHDGQLLATTRQQSNELIFEIPFLDYVKKTGFWFVLAGFSTTVFRRNLFDLNLFDKFHEKSKIYSHASTLVGSYYDKKFKFFNISIVEYRQNKADVIDTGHWLRAAVSQGVSRKHFWVKGFISHLELLIKLGVIDHKFLSDVIDLSVGRRFRFIDHMIGHMLEEIQSGFKTKSEQLTESDFALLISFMEKTAPEYYDLWIELKSASKSKYNLQAKKFFDTGANWFYQRSAGIIHFLDNFRIAESGKFNISKYGNQYYAYDRTNMAKVFEIVSYFDIQEVEPYLFISETLENLLYKVINFKIDTEFGKSPSVTLDLSSTTENLLNRQAHIFRSTSWEIFGPIRVIKRYFLWVFQRIQSIF